MCTYFFFQTMTRVYSTHDYNNIVFYIKTSVFSVCTHKKKKKLKKYTLPSSFVPSEMCKFKCTHTTKCILQTSKSVRITFLFVENAF